MFERQKFPEVVSITEKQKVRFSEKTSNVASIVWDLMVDLGETQFNEIPDSHLKAPGPITDLYVVYRHLLDIRDKFDGK